MLTSAIKEKETPQVLSKKTSKTPVIFVVTEGITDDLKKNLLEGLSHLETEVLSEQDAESALLQSNIIVLVNEDREMLKKAWKKGIVPVTKAFIPEIKDYNPNTENGNSFVYKNQNVWEIYAAVVRALETYKFPYDWKFIVRSCNKSS